MITKDFKAEYKPDERYCNHKKLLSHNANISWSQSIRNLGKSYDAMRLVRKTVEKGRNCVWNRWDRNETEIAKAEFMRYNVDDKYTEYNIKNSPASYIQDNDSGCSIYFMPVKQASSLKGLDIPKIKWMVYDECIPEFYDIKTRRDIEFDKFMSLYKTLKRDTQDFRALLMCNVIDWFNGYTRAWEISPFDAGIIRTFIKDVVVDIDGEIYKSSQKIAFENVKPSKAMIQRNLEDEILKGNTDFVKAYYANKASKEYNMIAQCPNLNIPLEPMQWRRGNIYISYRVHGGYCYFVETKPRDIATDVFSPGDIGHREMRRPSIGTWLEELINSGKACFSNGHVYNTVIGGIWDYRKRI